MGAHSAVIRDQSWHTQGTIWGSRDRTWVNWMQCKTPPTTFSLQFLFPTFLFIFLTYVSCFPLLFITHQINFISVLHHYKPSQIYSEIKLHHKEANTHPNVFKEAPKQPTAAGPFIRLCTFQSKIYYPRNKKYRLSFYLGRVENALIIF